MEDDWSRVSVMSHVRGGHIGYTGTRAVIYAWLVSSSVSFVRWLKFLPFFSSSGGVVQVQKWACRISKWDEHIFWFLPCIESTWQHRVSFLCRKIRDDHFYLACCCQVEHGGRTDHQGQWMMARKPRQERQMLARCPCVSPHTGTLSHALHPPTRLLWASSCHLQMLSVCRTSEVHWNHLGLCPPERLRCRRWKWSEYLGSCKNVNKNVWQKEAQMVRFVTFSYSWHSPLFAQLPSQVPLVHHHKKYLGNSFSRTWRLQQIKITTKDNNASKQKYLNSVEHEWHLGQSTESMETLNHHLCWYNPARVQEVSMNNWSDLSVYRIVRTKSFPM